VYFVQFGCLWNYRDKKVVGVFVRFRAPLHKPDVVVVPVDAVITIEMLKA
jgi:hypothetical protein